MYAPVPYKGYSIRAQSPNAKTEVFIKAFRDFLIPFHQEVIITDPAFLERVVSIHNNALYLNRIFYASEKARLDELGRKGIVAHIVEIPINHIKENRVEIYSVDEAMNKYVTESFVPMGSMEPLRISYLEGMSREQAFIINYIPEEFSRNVLSKVSSMDRLRIFIISRRLQKIDLIFALSYILSNIEQNDLLIASARISSELIPLFNKVIIVGRTLPPWARTRDWEIINLDKLVERTTSPQGSRIDEVIKRIYGSRQ